MAKVYLIRCRDAGEDCDFETRGSSLDELIERCAEHGSREHGMKAFGPELYTRMRSCIQVVEEEPSKSPN